MLDWLNLLVRWFHLTAGIAWIGASFYFVWLDGNLVIPPAKAEDVENGVYGVLWSVHGGGFYHNQKFLTGPKREPLTRDLHWFKWEAYSTWLSGIAMMAIVYWAGAGTYLIDKSVLALTPPQAIAISVGSLVAGWLVYDGLCRVLSGRPLLLGAAIFVLLCAAAFGLGHVFSGRAAYLHVGAIAGTIMAANVLFAIIPGQKKMLAQIRAGETPDPAPGRIRERMRSMHNTYLTLPVLFIMISNHYPMTYESPYGWAVLAVLSLASILVRQFYLLTHRKRLVPGLLAVAAVLVAGVAVALAPRPAPGGASVSFETVAPIFRERCSVCHAAHPVQPGFSAPPQGVLLDTQARIEENAPRIYEQAVATHNMPAGNVTRMTDGERTLVGEWILGREQRDREQTK